MLYQIYSDDINLIYLKFPQPIVSELTRLNKIFLLNKPNAAKLLTELLIFYQSLLERIDIAKDILELARCYKKFNLSDENLLHIDAVDFGVQVRLVLLESKEINDQALLDMEHRCRDYILELSKEIKKRLPDNMKQLDVPRTSLGDKLLSPSHVLSSSKPSLMIFLLSTFVREM